MRNITFISFIIASIIVAGCSTTKLGKYDKEKCTNVPGDAVMKVIDDKCMLCHSGDFSSREDICSRKSLIIDAVQSGRMPKIGSLTKEQINTLTAWR